MVFAAEGGCSVYHKQRIVEGKQEAGGGQGRGEDQGVEGRPTKEGRRTINNEDKARVGRRR